MTATTWNEQASCRNTSDPSLFFPPPHQSAIDLQKTERAKRICHSCPVRRTCLNYAMRMEGSAKADYRAGIYGGLTPRERYNQYARTTTRQRRTTEQTGAAS